MIRQKKVPAKILIGKIYIQTSQAEFSLTHKCVSYMHKIEKATQLFGKVCPWDARKNSENFSQQVNGP